MCTVEYFLSVHTHCIMGNVADVFKSISFAIFSGENYDVPYVSISKKGVSDENSWFLVVQWWLCVAVVRYML